jgi:hypothetical protein
MIDLPIANAAAAVDVLLLNVFKNEKRKSFSHDVFGNSTRSLVERSSKSFVLFEVKKMKIFLQ